MPLTYHTPTAQVRFLAPADQSNQCCSSHPVTVSACPLAVMLSCPLVAVPLLGTRLDRWIIGLKEQVLPAVGRGIRLGCLAPSNYFASLRVSRQRSKGTTDKKIKTARNHEAQSKKE